MTTKGMLHKKFFGNKEFNTATWGYLGGFGYIYRKLNGGQFLLISAEKKTVQ